MVYESTTEYTTFVSRTLINLQLRDLEVAQILLFVFSDFKEPF